MGCSSEMVVGFSIGDGGRRFFCGLRGGDGRSNPRNDFLKFQKIFFGHGFENREIKLGGHRRDLREEKMMNRENRGRF